MSKANKVDRTIIKDVCSEVCGANCCKAFVVTKYNELKDRPDLDIRTRLWFEEDIRPLTEQEVRDMNLIPAVTLLQSIHTGSQYFTCTLLDWETNLCTSYESRCRICRDTPAKGTIMSYINGCELQKLL